ncbi:MAG TPA: S8 family serine peptidase [Roseiflexaceae bacterium]|nr:S8 family serine peptidase [Roseiflexaceae bacterium]
MCAALALALLWAGGPASAQNITEPNDPLFEDQWALPHIGSSCAWGYTIGSDSVTVAVVDSGVDMTHPDLLDRLRDDGRDFVDGDNDPSDENGHGTNVAGVVAATLDNAEGIAGLAPGVRILPIRVMNDRGFGSDRAIERGIRYAADQGAQVINLSLGATLSIGADSESVEISRAIRYAQSLGSLVVVAAGNDFVPLPNAIVGENPDVLVVAATDENDRKAPFSNSGPWIAVTAPGVHILSTMPTYEVYLTSDRVPRDERFRPNYDYMSGTSQATPYVSALAALLFSANPDWDAGQVAQAIRQNAVDISEQNRKLWAQGYLGTGRIDACAALGGPVANRPEPTPVPPELPTPEPAPTSAPIAGVEPTDAPAPTRRPQAATPVPETSSTGDSTLGLSATLGAGICGLVLLLLLLVGVGRMVRRRPPSGQTYTPPRPSASVPQPVPVGPPIAAGWGALLVVGGPAAPVRFALVAAETVLGRSPDCTIAISGDETISRHHTLVRNDGRQVTVEDLGSTHGTYLNGQRVLGPTAVRRGDVMQIGQTSLLFE